MDKHRKRLTSVNVDKNIHKEFKILSIKEGITFQKLVNLTLEMYIHDKDFRNKFRK
jgi:hypothetical protein